MIRTTMMERGLGGTNDFRLRGREVSRLEALSDAVFGFAITLLVVSLEVPRTATELFAVMRGFPAFAACFALLFFVWWHQFRFFRRYGLDDRVTMVLNAVLLFVVLFFVYPLKFVFGFVVATMTGDRPWLVDPGTSGAPLIGEGQWVSLMVVFSAGYVAVFLVFLLLHLHAYRLRDALELDALERFDTVDNVRENGLNVAVGLLSIALALGGGPRGPFLAGIVYWSIGPLMFVHGYLSGRARGRVTREAAGAPVAG